METSYDPHCWNCIGPGLLTKTAKKMANVSFIEDINPSPILPVVPQNFIQPGWIDSYFSENPISFEAYQSMLSNASAVHFYNAMTSNILVEDDPQHFLYALLGPRYCPNSYYSTNYFWNINVKSLLIFYTVNVTAMKESTSFLLIQIPIWSFHLDCICFF